MSMRSRLIAMSAMAAGGGITTAVALIGQASGVVVVAAGAAGALLSGAGAVALQESLDASADRRSARTEREAMLRPLQRPHFAAGPKNGYAALLNPKDRTVPFKKSRAVERRTLHQWAKGDDGSRTLLIAGPSGVGKTRLALEFALELEAEGWIVGWLSPRVRTGIAKVLRTSGQPAMILLDDGVVPPDVALGLVEELSAGDDHPPVRMLLVARDTGVMGRDLDEHARHPVDVVVLGDLGRSPPARHRLFNQAAGRFGELLGRPVAPRMPYRDDPEASLRTIHAAALLSVLRPGRQPSAEDPALDIFTELLNLETRSWPGRLPTGLKDLSDDLQRRIVAMLAVTEETDRPRLSNLLRLLPELNPQSAVERRTAAAEWALRLWETGPLPKPMAEILVTCELATPHKVLGELVTGRPAEGIDRLDDDRIAHALRLLAGAVRHRPDAEPLLLRLIHADLRRTAYAAVEAGLAGPSIPLDRVLAGALDGAELDDEVLLRLIARMPPISAALPHAAAAISAAEVRHARRDGNAVRLGKALTSLGRAILDLDRAEEALPLYEEAICLLRAAAADRPTDPANPGTLATALSGLGETLVDLGRAEDSLPHHEEAIRLLAQAADRPPGTHQQNHLASALCHLGSAHFHLGRHADALPLSEEAVRLLRESTANRSTDTAYQSRLAFALGSVGSTLRDLGRSAEALPHLEEALHLRRSLATSYPVNVHYQEGLAVALGSLGVVLDALSSAGNSLPYHEETARILRILSREPIRGVRVERHLAAVLNNLGRSLIELAQHADAFICLEEAVSVFRVVTNRRPDDFRSHLGLAVGLTGLGRSLISLGRPADALPHSVEGVRLLQMLTEREPASVLFQEDLAIALSELGQTLSSLSRPTEAMPYHEAATHLRRKLTATANYTVEPLRFVVTLTRYGACLSTLRRFDAARSTLSDVLITTACLPAAERARASDGIEWARQELLSVLVAQGMSEDAATAHLATLTCGR